MPHVKQTTWDLLVSGEDLDIAAKTRVSDSLVQSISLSDLDSYLKKGWEVKKEFKTKVLVTKKKPIGDAFEDELWSIFYKMGFKVMNSSNAFALMYSKEFELSKQIDIVAIDDEVCLFIECKESEKEDRRHNFDHDIMELGNIQRQLYKAISEKYPDRKCKYIFATKNYVLGDLDKERIKYNGMIHFDYSTVLYYQALVSHLGQAARFQLLSSLFSGQKIKGMNSSIPAIHGKMGTLDYYTFLIEPEQLLKIGYVLHRTNANNDYVDLLPSYQRLIKAERLKQVQAFVNAGGYFPNSIIISLDVDRGKRIFEAGKQPVETSTEAKMGTLYLPQEYQSAYIIDGQHRLYGYAGSDYAAKCTIPVVAFVNLDKTEQLKIFMEINENQKPVPKALRNILEIDIYSDSPDLVLRKKALLGSIAKRLGEDPKSSLYGRVIIGEDAKTERCCLTIEAIKNALEKTRFFDKYKKGGTKIFSGWFAKSDNNETLNAVYPVLRYYFDTIRTLCESEWLSRSSFLMNNNAIMALIRICDDIIGLCLEKDPNLIRDTSALCSSMEDYILLLCTTLTKLDGDKKQQITVARGTSAQEVSYRIIQVAMYEADASFCNEEIEKYYIEHCVNYNDETKVKLTDIKVFVVEFTKSIFSVHKDWKTMYLSLQHESDLATRIQNKQIANRRNGIFTPIDEWDEITLTDIVQIIKNGSNWTDIYREFFKEKGFLQSKLDMIALLQELCEIEAKINNGRQISKSFSDTVAEFYKKLFGKE